MAQKRKNEHYPVVRKGRVSRQTPASDPKVQIFLNDFLSKTNRRLYRQSRNFTAKIDLDATAVAPIDVFVLNDSWMTERALKMAFDMYMLNSQDERDRLKDSSIARWEDFRVLSGITADIADPAQYSDSLVQTRLIAGEFANTRVFDAAGVAHNFTWGAATASRYSIPGEYDKAGNAQASPESSTNDVPYDDLMADDNALMAADLQNLGNLPPYDQNGVNADRQWVKVASLSTGATQRLSTGFFNAPCGIVVLAAPNLIDVVNADTLSWEVKAGDYKGVHAPSMVE